MTDHEPMTQTAPYPQVLAGLVKRLRYRVRLGWEVALLDDYQRDKPGRHAGESRGLTLVVTRCGPDTYHPERTIAVSHLIFDGVVARNPKIKFIAAHGGGYIAHYWARMDHAWRARKDCRTVIKRAPSTYLEKFYFDSITFDPMMLKHLIDRFGAEHVLMGTDYPYDMGEDDPRGLIAAVKGLPAAQRKQIEGLNAMKLLKIKL